MSVVVERYVEMTYRLGDGSHFYAIVTEAGSPNAAVEEARRRILDAHPEATAVEEFLCRTLTGERATAIRQAFADRTWTGWPLG